MRSSAVTWQNRQMVFLLSWVILIKQISDLFYLNSTSMSTPHQGKQYPGHELLWQLQYKALPRSHFGQSDHISQLLMPTYTQLIKRVKPSEKTVKVWTDEATAALQDCFECTDWHATKDNHINLEEYTSWLTSYISKCVDVVITMANGSSDKFGIMFHKAQL